MYIKFKWYIFTWSTVCNAVCDAGSKINFCLSLGHVHNYSLNKELGRDRGREGKTECSLCGDECENVSHVLWDIQVLYIELVL